MPLTHPFHSIWAEIYLQSSCEISMKLSLLKSAVAASVVALLVGCGGSDPAPSSGGSLAFATPTVAFKDAQSSFELANYSLAGRYSLPVGTGVNLLAEEASAVAYNKDTDTLFILGDAGTAIVQVTKQGVLIDSMTLARDAAKPQGTYFYDPEGLAYLGGGKFVLVEERYRQVNEFTYTPNTTMPANTLTATEVRTVKLGTTIGNIGIEGISYDPMTNGYIAVKESGPSGVFQTTINFAASTASNGSATAVDSVNLFDPTLTGLTALNDVFSMSNILTTTAPDYSHIMILSAPDGKIVKMDRTGRRIGTLVVGSTAQNEGMTMDASGNIYVVSEQGGGAGRPELLVYTPTVSKNSVGVGSNVYVTFNQTIVAGTGSITLSNGAGDVRSIPIGDTAQVKISGNTLMIDPATDLLAGSVYSITYPAGILKDAAGNASPALASATLLNFTTTGNADTTAPLLTSSSPADDAMGVASSRIVLTFNEAVTASVGNISINHGTDSRIISVTDAAQVIFLGNTVSIVPSTDLLRNAAYHVQIAAGAIRDTAGNAFAGITSTTALNFTTAAPTPPVAPTLLISEANTNAVGGDFFELYNYGTAAIDLTGYKWVDEAASFSLSTAGTFPSVSIPAGGRLVINSAATDTVFRSSWGLDASVPVLALAGPGVGAGDAFVLFNASGRVVAAINFKATSLTASDATVIAPATAAAGATFTGGLHAGAAFGANQVASAVWDGVSTSAPAYKAAAVGVLNGFAQPAVPLAVGSPGR